MEIAVFLLAFIFIAVSKDLSIKSAPSDGAGVHPPVPATPLYAAAPPLYPAAATEQRNPAPAPAAPVAPPAASAPTDDDFAAALDECSSPQRKPGVWAKAFTEALGNEGQARALYSGRRAAEMASDRAELARKEMLRTEEGRARLEREAYEAKPKGECPNCRTILPLDAESCTNATCGATFFAIGGWRIKPLST